MGSGRRKQIANAIHLAAPAGRKDIEDYFVLFENECTLLTMTHTCAGRVARVLDHVRDTVIGPPVVDGHISDSGWREVDQEYSLSSGS